MFWDRSLNNLLVKLQSSWLMTLDRVPVLFFLARSWDVNWIIWLVHHCLYLSWEFASIFMLVHWSFQDHDYIPLLCCLTLLYDNLYYSNEVLRKELQYFNTFVKKTGQLGVFPLMAWLCMHLCLWKIMFHYYVFLAQQLVLGKYNVAKFDFSWSVL